MALEKRRQCRLALSLRLFLILLWISPGQGRCVEIVTETIGKNMTVVHGAVNGILIERQGKRLAVYGDPRPGPDAANAVLFTHHRRDVVWTGRALVEQGDGAVVPAREESLFTHVDTFWRDFQQKRFHDYAQQTSKVLGENLPVARTVQGGDTVVWQGQGFRVLETPGYTHGAVTYLVDLLKHPAAYRLPCLTTHPIHVSGPLDHGATWRWKEFVLTAYNFPGQTLYHDALLVKKDGGETIFFIGDSFTPSGIDDYCLQNRNFLGEGQGYLQCLDLLTQVPSGTWLINQHVKPAFRFSAGQISRMEDTLENRIALVQAVSVWDNPNDALDESWAHVYPYLLQSRPETTSRCRLNIMNHSINAQTFEATVNLPEGWQLNGVTPASLVVPPQQEGSVEIRFTPARETPAGVYTLTVNLKFGQRELREWCEAMVTIER